MSDQSTDQKLEATKEIVESFKLCTFSMRNLGLSFDKPKSTFVLVLQRCMIALSFFTIFYHVFSDVVFFAKLMANSPKVEDIVPTFHTFGFGLLCTSKLVALWYKKDVFGQLLRELVEIWPMPPLNAEAQAIKTKSLTALRLAHRIFYSINAYGVWFYFLTPIVTYLYEIWWLQDETSRLGFIWKCWYPFDKYQTVNHAFVYLFETLVGLTCIWTCLGSDLLFTGVTSHICMLLRILQRRVESLTFASSDAPQNYRQLVDCIKLHQRLIKYCTEVEKAFSVANLFQILMSSINICCVLFVVAYLILDGKPSMKWMKMMDTVIVNAVQRRARWYRHLEAELLEPLIAVSNKLFIISALFQIGVICVYADDIIQSNAEVAMSAYKSNWHNSDSRCRRALLFFIIRAQKPIAITAMGFTRMDLVTYTAILTRSYSYFTLLYSMFTGDKK